VEHVRHGSNTMARAGGANWVLSTLVGRGPYRLQDENGKPTLPLAEVHKYMEELAAGLAYLHENGQYSSHALLLCLLR
jgi:serine/threonine protein kinase